MFGTSRLQHSIAVDITASEAFGFSIAAIMTEIVRGYLEDLGMASATAQATPIVTDNDATMRIASDAASAKRALHILRIHDEEQIQVRIILDLYVYRYGAILRGEHRLSVYLKPLVTRSSPSLLLFLLVVAHGVSQP